MNPMDIAWRLLKMPLLDKPPETYQNPNLKNPQQIYQFQDPVTEEVQDLHIAPAANPESNTLYAGIGDRAHAKFNDLPSGDYMSLDGVETDEEFQQRGYMTAIYDALENYLREHKGDAKLLPSDFQSEGGKALWANRKLTGEPMEVTMRLLKTIEEGYHPELGSFLTNPLDDMYVDMTSMYGNHPQYEGMSGTEMHEDMDRQIRERLDSQGHDPNLFDMWINEGGEHYGNIDEEQKSALKQTMLDIMEEHGGKTIHHDNFEEKNAGEPMDLAWQMLKMPYLCV